MTTAVAGRLILPLLLVTALLLTFLVSAVDFNPQVTGDSVHYNVTTHIDTSNATPFDIWLLAAVLGTILFFWTIIGKPASTSDVERDAVISVVAWVPIAFTAYSSFAVERITSSGTVSTAASGIVLLENHVIYHFDAIGIIFAILFVIAIINTIRILAVHKALRLQQETGSYQTY
jgi:hypothetical protein